VKWVIEHTGQLEEVAADFLAYTEGKTLFALYGQMGVGKTTFVKAVVRVSGGTDDVSSPTFSLVNEYGIPGDRVLYHFDFYRIREVTEALDLGYEEYFFSGNPCYIEWPEKIEELLPPETVCCYFRELPDGKRELEVEWPAL
jgi:tRNA threonylcarbamoyladenosine biosynthesis protein TsaE